MVQDAEGGARPIVSAVSQVKQPCLDKDQWYWRSKDRSSSVGDMCRLQYMNSWKGYNWSEQAKETPYTDRRYKQLSSSINRLISSESDESANYQVGSVYTDIK